MAHRLSFAEMVVPYRDATPDHYRRTAFDKRGGSPWPGIPPARASPMPGPPGFISLGPPRTGSHSVSESSQEGPRSGRWRPGQKKIRRTDAITPIATMKIRSAVAGSRRPTRAPIRPPMVEPTAISSTTIQDTGAKMM